MSEPHILVVDDDREIRRLVAEFLGRHGFRVSQAGDGAQVTKALAAGRIDLIVLDLMLPGEDGLQIIKRLRAGADIPVIMLTAMAEDHDRIVGLELGADDYITKPFNPRELLARIKAVLRRAPKDRRRGRYRFAGWTLDAARRELTSPDGVAVTLSSGEFDLLLAFLEHPQVILNRDQLLDLARGREGGPFDRTIDVQVSRLRRKLEADPAEPAIIKTVRNGGYLFAPAVEPT